MVSFGYQPEEPPLADLAERWRRGAVLLIDVREAVEHEAERIPSSLLEPLSRFDPQRVLRLAAESGLEPVLYCRSGSRTITAARQLKAAGAENVRHLCGGILAWKAAGHPTES